MPFDVGRLFRLARKELTEILRDRRTIVTLVLMPLLLYPLLSIAFLALSRASDAQSADVVYNLGFQTRQEGDHFMGFLQEGMQELSKREGFPRPGMSFFEFLDAEEDVRSGRLDLAFRKTNDGPSKVQADTDVAQDWEMIYREDSAYGREAAAYFKEVAVAANLEYLIDRLRYRKVETQRPEPLHLEAKVLTSGDKIGHSLTVFVPLVLILMTITGAVYPAIDLTAGERERGTLEVLIAAPVPRTMLLGAKYIAVVTVAVLTALVNLAAMMLSLVLSGNAAKLSGLSVLTVVEILGLLLLFAAFFSAVLLVVTSFARSFKEAQAYLIPLMLVSLAPGLLALMPGLSLSGPLAIVPLLNIVLLARDLLQARATGGPAVVVVLSTVFYAILAVALAARLFGAEAVLYSEAGGWGWGRKKHS